MRSIAASTFVRTCSSKLRTLSPSVASAGMMLFFVPAWICPTVTTAASVAASSLATMPCSRTVVAAARYTGSTVVSGRDP